MMNNAELEASLGALPQATQAAIKRLVSVLREQGSPRRLPPIMRPSEPLTEAEKQAEQADDDSWASRTDITDGAEYIHQVRRGLRQP